MADAYARGKRPEGTRRGDTTEDAFVEGAVRLASWVVANLRTVVILLVVVGLIVGGMFYWRGYRATVRERAAVELATLRTQAETDAATALPQLETFIARFDGTPAAAEARLLLARLELDAGRGEEAIAVLEAVDAPADTPTGYAARLLLAAALEQLGQPEAALEVYQALGRSARYGFERRNAQAAAARILADLGRPAEAEQILSRLVDEATAADAPSEAALYRIRLGEVRGRLQATR